MYVCPCVCNNHLCSGKSLEWIENFSTAVFDSVEVTLSSTEEATGLCIHFCYYLPLLLFWSQAFMYLHHALFVFDFTISMWIMFLKRLPGSAWPRCAIEGPPLWLLRHPVLENHRQPHTVEPQSYSWCFSCLGQCLGLTSTRYPRPSARLGPFSLDAFHCSPRLCFLPVPSSLCCQHSSWRVLLGPR